MRSYDETMRKIGASKYDNVHRELQPSTTWEEVLKSSSMRYLSQREKFDVMDKNGDGYIDADDLADHPHASEMIRVADQNNNGKLDYQEFLDLLKKTQSPASTPSHTPSSSPPKQSFFGMLRGKKAEAVPMPITPPAEPTLSVGSAPTRPTGKWHEVSEAADKIW